MDNKCDVVVIGAGIGGLTAGCYMAKYGLRVSVIEQHDKPGGYCSSFSKNGYHFDAGAHSLGSMRNEGVISNVLNDLGVLKKFKYITSDITDRVIMPDETVYVYRDSARTINELKSFFPKESKNIDNFFKFVLESKLLTLVSKTKSLTFGELLNDFFTEKKLKSILSVFMGNLGLPPSRASALASVTLFKEFVFDGGYYPKGGMQEFANLLTKTFVDYGGKITLSTKVVEIMTERNRAVGVRTNHNDHIKSKVVLSNADATTTLNKMVKNTSSKLTFRRLQPSISAFAVYLGINDRLKDVPRHLTTWFFSTYDIDKCYSPQPHIADIDYLICSLPSLVDDSIAPKEKNAIRIMIAANYETTDTWNARKDFVSSKLLKKLNNLIPNVINCIEVKEIATPCAFAKITSNRSGALFGWAATKDQIDMCHCPSDTRFKNLYLTGHWVTKGVGQSSIPLVILCGKNAAKKIIRNIKS
ncbi:MAG: NAD(P)/FAD-dependent oxidoreductase [Candidatus Omnitrophica bacterium]|nr:NAD(P)/FAD-dependent oxidoreductase [Candidatus Omnitrophota bacterium]